MTVGTRSILYGPHCLLLHPWFVARAWWKLYGFPWDPRLWVAFFVHDVGYAGCPNMDGSEGEQHPWTGARIMGWAFDTQGAFPSWFAQTAGRMLDLIFGICRYGNWFSFTLFHSRYFAKRYNCDPSILCVADKLALCLIPGWLFLPLARATGEIHEYMEISKARKELGETLAEPKHASMNLRLAKQTLWFADVQNYLRRWVEENKDRHHG